MKQVFRDKPKGIALIAVIIIIAVSAIAVLGIATFISKALVLNTVRDARQQALCAAQAGLYAAIYDYKNFSYWSKITDFNLINNLYYSIGKDANFLLINASSPQITNSGGTDMLLQRIPLANVTLTRSITVNQMMVEWYNFSASLNRVVLGGSQRWTGSVVSGTKITLSRQFTLNTGQSFAGANDNIWRFTSAIPNNAIILVTFYFTDGSTRKAYLLNNGRSGNNEFSITATGRVAGATNWKRTVEATYDVEVGRITSWQETENHI